MAPVIATRRLVTVGHSYVVGLNRRLAHEIARAGNGKWEVRVVAPAAMPGDLRRIDLEAWPNEPCGVEPVDVHFASRIHTMCYGKHLKHLLGETSWDIVHAWEEPYILAGFQIAWWTPRRSRFVFGSFQNISKCYPPPFSWFERYSIWRASGWIAFGHTARETLHNRPGYGGKPHRVIPVGVDTELFRPDPAMRAAVRRKLGWSADGPPVVGYLGRFVAEKGASVLTRALASIKPAWRALFIGGGAMEAELRSWAELFPDRVRVLTGIPHDRVPAYLSAMDILAAPSQTTQRWREQLGRMLLEAFACGVAVIASDSGEIPNVVGAAGRLVGEADEAGWAAALSDLLDSPSQRAELAAHGRERASSLFSWQVVGRAHLDFFESLLDRPAGME